MGDIRIRVRCRVGVDHSGWVIIINTKLLHNNFFTRPRDYIHNGSSSVAFSGAFSVHPSFHQLHPLILSSTINIGIWNLNLYLNVSPPRLNLLQLRGCSQSP